jgi:hypothetical protein
VEVFGLDIALIPENTKAVAGPIPLVGELFEPAELKNKNANPRIGFRTVTIHIHKVQNWQSEVD